MKKLFSMEEVEVNDIVGIAFERKIIEGIVIEKKYEDFFVVIKTDEYYGLIRFKGTQAFEDFDKYETPMIIITINGKSDRENLLKKIR